MGEAAAILPDKLFFKIGEVAHITGVKPYVLRYWETEFPRIRPQKTRSQQRLYRRKDVETILLVKKLLWDERFTIEGARRRLKEVAGADAVEEELRSPRGDKRVAELEVVLKAAVQRADAADGRARESQKRLESLERIVVECRKDLQALLSFVDSP
ncbi:MAG: MerR family transcriptional regulator [Deltaproteobacteria bacterium]|nr:MerR family transcriptional regulator [Deltaproteobacteria bacterium]